MCRLLAYSGAPIHLQSMHFEPKDNLIDQSLTSKSAETPTNGDGFDVGWYDQWKKPGLFHSIRPAWNDFNLKDLAAHIESPMFMAHVRATSLAQIQETNCHPFRFDQWLFVHNGELFEIEKYRKDLLMAVAPEYFENIFGSTDSELMFHLALTLGLQTDVPQAISRMVALVEKTAKKHGVMESVWMTLGIGDGKKMYCFRYASDGQAPTLYYSPAAKEVHKVNPALIGRFGENARVVVSEPIGVYPSLWREVPQGSYLVIENGKVDVHPFIPRE